MPLVVPQPQNLQLNNATTNSTYILNMQYNDSSGNPVDLSAYTAFMQVVDNSGNIILTFTTSDGTIVLTAGGLITLYQTQVTMLLTTAGSYQCDFLLTDGSGNVSCVFTGSFTISQGISS